MRTYYYTGGKNEVPAVKFSDSFHDGIRKEWGMTTDDFYQINKGQMGLVCDIVFLEGKNEGETFRVLLSSIAYKDEGSYPITPAEAKDLEERAMRLAQPHSHRGTNDPVPHWLLGEKYRQLGIAAAELQAAHALNDKFVSQQLERKARNA